jgi:hypothetical protein
VVWRELHLDRAAPAEELAVTTTELERLAESELELAERLGTLAGAEPLRVAGLYLLHFEPRYRHARHYLGFSPDIIGRLLEHTRGGRKSSPLIRAALGAGCRLELVRVWLGAGRTEERRLKVQGSSCRLCPVCRARGEGARRARGDGAAREL